MIKTRIQIDPGLKGYSLIKGGRHIVATEGTKGLLTGFGPTAVGYLLQGGAKFAGYEASVSQIVRLLRIDDLVFVCRKNTSWNSLAVERTLSRIEQPFTLVVPPLPSKWSYCAPKHLTYLVFQRFFADILLTPLEATRIRLVSNPKVSVADWCLRKVG